MISAMPSAGRITPRTSPAGSWTTPMQSPVRTSTLTRTLKPRPKKAFMSPRTQYGTVGGDVDGAGAVSVDMAAPGGQTADDAAEGSSNGAAASAVRNAEEDATQPKMPPCAATISSPTRWNSGK